MIQVSYSEFRRRLRARQDEDGTLGAFWNAIEGLGTEAELVANDDSTFDVQQLLKVKPML